ncbi:MAG: hypothetical protein J6Y39_06510 [Bacteroidaceae bacterium]|nr:hypothetical protein [Bacteroidaceae bacterium]
MRNRIFILIFIAITGNIICLAQNYNTNVNQNQNNIIVNNQPVIERVKYIEKYRTVYVERPQPKRYARKLSAPVCLLSSIWVYVEDLGDFRSLADAQEIVNRLNAVGKHGRNDWRIPTSAELTVMEQNADEIGLGDGIYLATSHRNGILRPVSTGASISEKNRANQAYQRRLAEEERRQTAARNMKLQAQQQIINSGQGISDGASLIWAPKNVNANSAYEKGSVLSSYRTTGKWRLPSSYELSNFKQKAAFSQRPYNGVLRKVYVYKDIILVGGRYLTKDGYYDLGTSDGISGSQGYVRLVQDLEQ